MKKAFAKRLCIVILVSMLAMVFLSYYLQIKSAKEAIYNNSIIRINQITQILEKNDLDIERLKENLEEDYFIRAKAAAYIIQNNKEVIGNLDEIKKIASLLQVDELHLFDPEGTLFDGTEPQYYNYTFYSGTQMQFFLPMLNDDSLQLCQDVVPNTAENKLMQYIAVWREDHQGIIQIGMEPVRLIEAMSKNELTYIFEMVTTDKDTTIFAVDPETKLLVGATDSGLVGKSAEDIGIDVNSELYTEAAGYTAVIDGKKSYCIIRPADNVIVGVSTTYESIYRNIFSSMVFVIISISMLSFAIIILILMMLDRFIIHGIHEMAHGLKKIADGDLDFRVKVETSPEFIELGSNINNMVMSLLETTGTLSLVFENVNIPIAAYEYNQDMRRVLATSKIGDILMLSEQELHTLLSDHDAFHKKIALICSHPYVREEDTYLLGEEKKHYVKIKFYQENGKTLGIIVDMTTEVVEKQQMEQERDIDLLTGLFNRRAFYHEMDKLFGDPERLKTAVLLVVDMDNLKYANDNWGHVSGDRLLKKAADLLNQCEAKDKIVARLGGDEFALVIYHTDSEAEAKSYIDRMYEQITQSCIHISDHETIPICFSGGYVFCPEFGTDYNYLLHLADQTMYKVKKGEKGKFAKYEEEQ